MHTKCASVDLIHTANTDAQRIYKEAIDGKSATLPTTCILSIQVATYIFTHFQKCKIMKILNRVPRWDKHRAMHLKIGFIASLAFVLMAFNYTSYGPSDLAYDERGFIPEELEVTPPRMKPKTTVPPPPKPKVSVVDIIEPLDEPEFTNEPEHVEANTETVLPSEEPVEVETAAPAPKVKIVEAEEEGPAFVNIAERMPVYNTCDLDLDESEKRKCTTEAMLSHIYSNLKYPEIARENNIHGTVVVSFIIDKNGSLTNAEIMKDIGGGCGQAVLSVIRDIGKFYPGKQNGRPVSVIYRVPVKFDLK